MSLHHVIVMLLLAPICLGSHFRGGIITWTPTEDDLQIAVSYRVSWRRSSGHICDDSTISSGLLNNGEGNLECAGGLTVTSVQMSYYCTDFSISEDWTTGTRLLMYNLTASTTEVIFRYTSCCWIDLQTSGGGSWAVKAKASVTKRTDTGKINSSPTTSVSPIVRVPQGCSATINLLVADQDGDIVRCRWSNASDECGDICLSLPGAVLNEKTCTISYQANGTVGYYGVAIQVEDFAPTGGTVPYSSVPVQFLVYVYSTNLGCYSLPEFISPTRGDQEVVYITVNNVYFDRIVAISNVPNTSIVEITTVSPSGFIKSALAEYSDVPGSWYVNITWTPTTSDVNKLYILCFTATDKKGLTSQQRCINLIVSPDVAINGSSGSPSAKTAVNPTSTLTPSTGASTTPSSSNSVTAMDTYKTTSSGGTTTTFESTTSTTGSPSATTAVNPTSALTPSTGASTTPSSSNSVTAMDTYKTTSSGGTTTTFESTTSTTEACTHESLGILVPGIAGGIVAGFVVILCLVIGIFLWRRYQHAKQNEHDDDIKREREERV